MKKISTVAVTFVSTLALGGFALQAPAHAADEPCAAEQTKVDKATAQLAKVTAVFEAQKDKVAKAKDRLEDAKGPAEKANAKAKLAAAKEKKEKVAKAKKAQVQRLAKATAALEECLAEETPEEPAA